MTADWFDQAQAYFRAGDYARAESLYRQVLQGDPAHPFAHNNLGIILAARGNADEAIEHYQLALRSDPDCSQTYVCLGNALSRLGQAEEAGKNFARAIELNPYLAEAHNGLGAALLAQGRVTEAIPSFAQAANLRPNYAEAHSNRGIAYLLLGDYERGWPGYEWRWGMQDFVRQNVEGAAWPEYEARWLSGQPVPPFFQPRWDGSPPAGRTVLLFAEQGLGDTIQFIRYAPLVKERGATVIVQCQSELRAVLSGCGGIDLLVPRGAPVPVFDLQIPLASLPRIFGTTLSTIPAKVPYLHPDARLVEYWRQQWPQDPQFRIGIVWQGSPRFKGDAQRSIPLAEFAPLAALPGVQLISLQKGHGRQQLKSLPGPFQVLDLEGRLDETTGPFMDTAAIMRSIDMIITSDTAAAHLAGALGVRVWIALPSQPEWRWLLERSDCPWYPTARLFRQHRAGDWGGVFAQIAQELRKELATSS